MTKRFRIGLVVGKFAPLHKSHVVIVEAAREQCDQVVILSYSNPELDFAGPDRRAQWLSALFPDAIRVVATDALLAQWFENTGRPPVRPPNDADADAAVQRDFVALLLERVVGRQVDAVFTSETYGPGFADYLTRRFRTKDPATPTVTHVCVDPARLQVPVSASGSVGNICPRWSLEQIRREEIATTRGRRWVFCDTSPLTTSFYCFEQFGRVDGELKEASERRYDRVVLCAPDFAFVQDGTRRDSHFRDRQHHWYERELAASRVGYHLATGSLAQSVEALTDYLRRADSNNQ